MEDEKVVSLPTALVAEANRRAAESIHPDDLPTPHDLATKALRDVVEAVETLRRIARNSPELLPDLEVTDDHGFKCGVLRALWSADTSLAFIRREAESQVDRRRRGRLRVRPVMLPARDVERV